MYLRVLIYSSDYKHSAPSLTHPHTHSIMQGVDTPTQHLCDCTFLCKQWALLAEARRRANYTSDVGLGLPYEMEQLQYNSPT